MHEPNHLFRNVTDTAPMKDCATGRLLDQFVGETMGNSPSPLDIVLPAEVRSLRGACADDLIRVAGALSDSLARRFAAGTLLALIGDPRVRVFDPPMITIPPGCATLGLNREHVEGTYQRYKAHGAQRAWIEREVPRFTLNLTAFRIGKYPVTNAEYLVFMQETGMTEAPTSWSCGRFSPAVANHPVHSVELYAAESYARWLCERTERPFRLPTEFEWEYSASGPLGMTFPWGVSWHTDQANTLESGLLMTSPIGIFARGRSRFRLFDVAGNVEELVAHPLHPYPGADSALQAPLSEFGVTRGGAFKGKHFDARCQRRLGHENAVLRVVGFRLAESTA